MPRIFPFEALVYDPAIVGPLDHVTAPPYDVISESGKLAHRGRPFNIVQLDLADPHTEGGYAGANALLRGWIAAGALRRTAPAYQAYEMRFERNGEPQRVRGIMCALELEDWGGAVLPHERTMPGPVEDRLRLLRATRTHLSPVYVTVAGPSPDLGDLLGHTSQLAPDAEAVDEEGVVHRRWLVDARTPVDEWLTRQDLLIADGHHRYTTALAYRDEMRRDHGPGAWDRLLVFVVDAGSERLSVLPFHRLQRSGPQPAGALPLNDLPALMKALDDESPVVGLVDRTPAGMRYRALPIAGDPPAVRALHASFLDANVRADELRFTHSVAEATTAVEEGKAAIAYLLPSTTPDRIRTIVERGERLPQKSTFFWPKPRTGMVLMPLDDPAAG